MKSYWSIYDLYQESGGRSNSPLRTPLKKPCHSRAENSRTVVRSFESLISIESPLAANSKQPVVLLLLLFRQTKLSGAAKGSPLVGLTLRRRSIRGRQIVVEHRQIAVYLDRYAEIVELASCASPPGSIELTTASLGIVRRLVGG
jgi:hypothetical protein